MYSEFLRLTKKTKKIVDENKKQTKTNYKIMINILTITIINFLLIIGHLIIG